MQVGNANPVYRLSERTTEGVYCGKEGLFIGGVALLETSGSNLAGRGPPRIRDLKDLERDLSKAYRAPIDFGSKYQKVKYIAEALAHGELALAQISTLLLRAPEPPTSDKVADGIHLADELIPRLQASNMLKGVWNSDKHPRWPAGSPDSVGGQFAPAGDGGAVTPAQIVVPFDEPAPIPLPLLRPAPFPSEIAPPLVTPDLPRALPQNPYPSRPECVKEWRDAYRFCWGLKSQGLLGRGDYRGMGRSMRECLLGQVSESCGGNAASA